MAITRRHFLARSAALGCSAAASPFATPVVLAEAPGDARLVVIILRGGMDGLDVVRPYGDPDFARMRPQTPDDGTDLDGFFALHPALSGLHGLWSKGELSFAHATSTPYRHKRSHFDGQDFLENGGFQSDGRLTGAGDGWLNRLLPLMGGHTEMRALAVGRGKLRLLSGDAPHTSWSPDADLDLSDQGRLLLSIIYQNDPLFREAARKAVILSDETDTTMRPTKAGRAAEMAAFAADRLNSATRIAAFSLNGFDTHRSQSATLPRALSELETAILTLRHDLGRNWGKTAVLAMTEFGRTARMNGTSGTDHGTGGLMLLAGGAIAGGSVMGRWPGLGESDLFEGRDLMPTDDIRRYAAWAMHGLFGVERSQLGQSVFPGLDMGDNPGIIA